MKRPALPPADLPRLAPRDAASHKGDYGRALLIAGSRGMSGAAALAGMAALRSGAGLVEVATAAECQALVAGFDPSYMTTGLPGDAAGRIAATPADVEPRLARATALGCGPGLGRSAELDRLVAWLYQHHAGPAVFDADALNSLADQPQCLGRSGGPRVLTPHPGEFARLTGLAAAEVQADRRARAMRFARQFGVVLLLKGHRTLLTDGDQVFENSTGNPGMATGGTGDVLTGVLTALLAQGQPPLEAARLAAWVHGRAGDLAAERLGQISLTAGDLVRSLARAWREVATDDSSETGV